MNKSQSNDWWPANADNELEKANKKQLINQWPADDAHNKLEKEEQNAVNWLLTSRCK